MQQPRAWVCQRRQLLLTGPRLGDFLSLAYPMPSGYAVLRWQGGLSRTEMTTINVHLVGGSGISSGNKFPALLSGFFGAWVAGTRLTSLKIINHNTNEVALVKHRDK